MRRPVKVKRALARTMMRKSALSATPASRRGFPAWIDASEHGVAFPAAAVTVTPRVRDALVLRTVAKGKPSKTKGKPHAKRGR